MPDAPIIETPAAPVTPPATPIVETPVTPLAPTPLAHPAPRIEDIPTDQLNAFLAKHKRNLQTELAEAQRKAAGFDQLQTEVSGLLTSGIVDGVDDIEDFRNVATRTIEEFRTKEEKLATEKSDLAKELEVAKAAATSYTERYNSAQILRSVADAAATRVLDEGALELLQLKLEPLSEVNAETGNVTVKWETKDEETGKMVPRRLSMEDAIKHMEANPTKYRGLFKSTVSGGAGGEVVDGVRRTDEGGIDFESLSKDPVKYMELMKKNPEMVKKALENMRR